MVSKHLNRFARDIKKSLRTCDDSGDKTAPFSFKKAIISGAVIDKVRSYLDRVAAAGETKVEQAKQDAAVLAEKLKSNELHSGSINHR